ncbi:hypothetical protein BV898_03304 [Hypsibius exemplaris]|uniref:Uncharacterized protein n=1 Tax=Hypsibius exemplaris TaxID=2072580 RepID=A0A1W0X6C0_HYPEX|nr:hypothetical protein BV898_03304 [Hypsibius exemplaris]
MNFCNLVSTPISDPSAAYQPPIGSFIALAQTPSSNHSGTTYFTSQIFLPPRYLSDSFRCSGIPRSSSGLYSVTAARPPLSAIVLHPVNLLQQQPAPPPPPQAKLVLPGSARSRIRQHQAREEAAAAHKKSVNNSTEPIGKKDSSMAATAVHLSSPPPSSTSTPHHIHHHIAPAGYHNYSGYYTQQNDHGSPTVIVTDAMSQHIHPAEHFTPSRGPTGIGYPGGAHGHNPVVIRVVQKPVESLMVDGENPFRPNSDLYKEADELIKAYTLPRGSASPSPLPASSASSADQVNSEFPHLSDGGSHAKPQSPVKELPSSASSSSSSVSEGKPQSPREEKVPTKENGYEVERPRGKSDTSTEEEERPKEQRDTQQGKQPASSGKTKDKKKKRKPVGCGGDKSCSIM